jgi:hypothetical protein
VTKASYFIDPTAQFCCARKFAVPSKTFFTKRGFNEAVAPHGQQVSPTIGYGWRENYRIILKTGKCLFNPLRCCEWNVRRDDSHWTSIALERLKRLHSSHVDAGFQFISNNTCTKRMGDLNSGGVSRNYNHAFHSPQWLKNSKDVAQHDLSQLFALMLRQHRT